MKKVLFPILALVLALGLAIPMAAPAAAATTTITLVSGIATQTAGYVNANTLGDPLDPTAYSGVGVWSNAAAVTTPPIGPWVDPTTDPAFSGSGAVWVSSAGTTEEDPAGDQLRLFKAEFTIPTGAVPISAQVTAATADNAFSVYFGGSEIGTSGDVYGAAPSPQPYLFANVYGPYSFSPTVGLNTLYFVARNWDNFGGGNPAGLLYKAVVTYEEFVPAPAIEITKSADPTSAYEDDTITYTYNVTTGTGNVALSTVTVTDSPTPDTGPTYVSGDDSPANGKLDVGETWVYTASYTVPWFTAGPVDNEATASGWYDSTEYTDTDTESVAILHTPDIEVDKQGPPPVGYFLSTNATYTYIVTNPGNCSLNVSLTDDLTGAPVYVSGDTNSNLHLDPGETWTYTDSQLLECTDPDQQTFTNTATAVGTDATGATDTDEDSYSVTIFQWLPGRTIGYWSNWDNHWSETCILEMVERVDDASDVFNGLDADSVYAIIKGQDQKGKMDVAKAKVLLDKQLMAAWLNVQSGIGATDDVPGTCGSMDAALWQYATVYLSKVSGAATLFGFPTMTVIEVLEAVEEIYLDSSSTANELLLAKTVLDLMNNAQNNGYFMFIAP